jgi:alkylation response protein AidB-like acyl-CoA dehydrogenase
VNAPLAAAIDDSSVADQTDFEDLIGDFLTGHAVTLRFAGVPTPDRLRAVWARAGSLGLLALAATADRRRAVAITRRLGALGLLDLPLWMQSDVLTLLLARQGTPQQRALLPDVASGRLFLALALTERATGSSLTDLAACAVQNEGGYVLTAEKLFVTNAVFADRILVSARLESAGGPADRPTVGLFLVDARDPAVHVEATNLGPGLDLLGTGTVRCEQVRLPPAALLGDRPLAAFQLSAPLSVERFCLALMCHAAARGALASALARAATGPADGGEDESVGLLRHDAVAATFAMLGARVETVGALLDRLADDYIDRGLASADRAAAAKLEAVDLLVQVAEAVERFAGADGFRLRDAKTGLSPTELRRSAVAQGLAGGAAHALSRVVLAGMQARYRRV